MLKERYMKEGNKLQKPSKVYYGNTEKEEERNKTGHKAIPKHRYLIVNCHFTRRHTPEDFSLHEQRCESNKS